MQDRWRWLSMGALALPLALGGCEPSGAGDDDDGADDDGADDDLADDDGADDDGADDDTSDDPYGPENSWWHALAADVPEDLEGTGWAEGDTPNGFLLPDQYGDDVDLYQFYGQVIVLDLFTGW